MSHNKKLLINTIIIEFIYFDCLYQSLFDDDLEMSKFSQHLAIGVIPTNALHTIHRLLDVDEFSEWFCMDGGQNESMELMQQASSQHSKSRRGSVDQI